MMVTKVVFEGENKQAVSKLKIKILVTFYITVLEFKIFIVIKVIKRRNVKCFIEIFNDYIQKTGYNFSIKYLGG